MSEVNQTSGWELCLLPLMLRCSKCQSHLTVCGSFGENVTYMECANGHRLLLIDLHCAPNALPCLVYAEPEQPDDLHSRIADSDWSAKATQKLERAGLLKTNGDIE